MSLRAAAQQMERFGSDQRDRLAHLHQRFHFGALRLGEPAFIVPVHQLLQATVCLGGQPEPADRLDPFDEGGNDGAQDQPRDERTTVSLSDFAADTGGIDGFRSNPGHA